jgi:photosystem II stability/assembly factor-like uncharacterized protein
MEKGKPKMKMRILRLLFLAAMTTSCSALLFAGAAHKTDRELTQIYFADSKHGWVLGHGDNQTVLLRTLDSGNTWAANSISDLVIKIKFVDVSNGWAIGAKGTIFFTSDGGETWSKQDSGSSETLYDLHIIDRSHVWVSGNHGTLLLTENGGNTWVRRKVDLDVALTGVAFAGTNRGWAIGYETILATKDGGLTWKAQSSGEWKQLSSIAFVNENCGWIATVGSSLLRTRNGGATWEEIVVPGIGRAAMSFVDSEYGWVSLSKGSSTAYQQPSPLLGPESKVLATNDGGNRWKELLLIKTEDKRRAWIFDLFFLDRMNGWAVGSDGLFLKTIDGGKHWETKYLSPDQH